MCLSFFLSVFCHRTNAIIDDGTVGDKEIAMNIFGKERRELKKEKRALKKALKKEKKANTSLADAIWNQVK